MHKDYYIKQEKKLINDYMKLIKRNRTLIEDYYGKENTTMIIDETVRTYKGLIPELPYIGGKKNFLTSNLIGSLQLLALIKTLNIRGETNEKIGEILYNLVENVAKSNSKIILKIVPKLFFSKHRIDKMKTGGLLSQQKKYPEDWVYEISLIDKNTFELCYTECGICKLYKKLGYEEFIPYLCLTDYAKFSILGIRLERTKTIGNGDDICDFKFVKNGIPVKGWPPTETEEFTLPNTD